MKEQENFFIVSKRGKGQLKPAKQEPHEEKIRQRSRIQLKQPQNRLKNYRISSQAVINSPETSSLVHSVTCPICLNLLPVPYYECQVCSNNFCPACIQDWWKKEPETCIFKCEQAQFKLIKRSNTYNAVVSMLKVPCEHCKQEIPAGQLVSHLIKYCDEVEECCDYCEGHFTRKVYRQHIDKCPKKPMECEFCQQTILLQNKQSHQASCPQKLFDCKFQNCKQIVKRVNFEEHISKCSYKPVKCQWCSQTFLLREMEAHLEVCPKRIIRCTWCEEQLFLHNVIEHQHSCNLRRVSCQLCHELIMCKEISKHKIECMFSNMLEIKQMNSRLVRENVQLKEKISVLEDIIEQNLQNRKSETMKIFRDMKEGEKKNLERDLLRINNSIKSVEKLKNQEFQSHMKFPHLLQSWCPICKELEKKFKSMLQPLLVSRKDVLIKLAEVEKFQTPC